MANAISQFRLPVKLSDIPSCIISQLTPNLQSTLNNQQLTINNCNLNPRFFSYGQFPLYLAYFSDQITQFSLRLLPTTNYQLLTTNYLSTNFPSAIFWLRLYSTLSSIFTVFFVFLLCQKLLPTKYSLFAALATAFSPGLIQSAHFGTTESFLTFFFLASIYFSMKLMEIATVKSFPKYFILNTKYLILLSFTIGLALGSKLTGIFFLIPTAITLLIQIIQLLNKRSKKRISGLLAYGFMGLLVLVGSTLIFFISSPYNLADPADFKSAVFGYESDVATGRYEAFYTRQFANTTPILFQAEKIFPYALGWPVFILGSLGFITAVIILFVDLVINFQFSIFNFQSRFKLKIFKFNKNFKFQISNYTKNKKRDGLQLLFIVMVSLLIYFLPNAFLFAKWTRFMTPILPFFSIFAAFTVYLIYRFIKNFSRKIQNYFYLLIFAFLFSSILPGLMFMSIYTHDDSRLQASYWIYNNIPDHSYVLSETANVVDIPLGIAKTTNQQSTSKNYTVISFDFYHMDENPQIFQQLLNHLEKSDFIFIPSRRIFANYPNILNKYPLVTKYYQLLFSGALGFEKVSEIYSFPQLSMGNYQLSIPDEGAEETFTVFDHPVIRIYRKIKPITIDEYRSLFNI
ncbi:glycosyltransferase family 39 protein [Candidatus Gottesmanbacteria bacterium]|nr:glycosyltransferase family 39 protein [Candidatus Gottesmanbacteria bacterium]